MKRLSKKERRSWVRTYYINPTKEIMAQLQDIDFYPRMSDETLAFNAKLVLVSKDERFEYNCANSGNGGSTNIYPSCSESSIKDARLLLDEWDKHLKTKRDDTFYEIAELNGIDVSFFEKEITKSSESEVNHLLAEWCEEHNL